MKVEKEDDLALAQVLFNVGNRIMTRHFRRQVRTWQDNEPHVVRAWVTIAKWVKKQRGWSKGKRK